MTLKPALPAVGCTHITTLLIASCAVVGGWTGGAAAQTSPAAPYVPQAPRTAPASPYVPQQAPQFPQPQPQPPLANPGDNAQPAAAPPEQTAAPGQTFEEEIVPQRYANNPDVDAFINDMVARYDFDPNALHALFSTVSYSATAVKLVTPQPGAPKAKNWRAYQARFLDPQRISAGVQFWRENRETLQRASAEFGVPPEVIVGIIGVETMYGRNMGSFRVLDALTTLAFDYPAAPNRADRIATFRQNLEDYLVWTRDAQIDPTTVLGSYTGAIGIPQFLPSSIVRYAVDYEGNAPVDLRTSQADAIASVANYLKQNGWETGRPVVWRINSDPGSQGIARAAATGDASPQWPLNQLLRSGLTLAEPGIDPVAEANTPVTIVDLPTPGRPTEYMLGLQNFYVLTRYNRSFFYALAVYQLGMRVKSQMLATEPNVGSSDDDDDTQDAPDTSAQNAPAPAMSALRAPTPAGTASHAGVAGFGTMPTPGSSVPAGSAGATIAPAPVAPPGAGIAPSVPAAGAPAAAPAANPDTDAASAPAIPDITLSPATTGTPDVTVGPDDAVTQPAAPSQPASRP